MTPKGEILCERAKVLSQKTLVKSSVIPKAFIRYRYPLYHLFQRNERLQVIAGGIAPQ